MTCSQSVSLLKGASLVDIGEEKVAIEALPHLSRPRLTFNQVTPALLKILQQLSGEGASLSELSFQALQNEGTEGLAKLHHYLGRLNQYAMLSYRILIDDVPFAGITPLSNYFHFNDKAVNLEQRYRLSRFTYCHYTQDGFVIESALGHAKVELFSPGAAAALQLLGKPLTVSELALAVDALDEESAAMFMNYLVNMQSLVIIAEDGTDPEAEDSALAQWDFHDLVFHTRCRLGRHSNPFGGTYPFKDKFAPLPAIKPDLKQSAIALPVPDLAEVRLHDADFTTVLEERASIREQGEIPITIEQLGEFLYRSARVKKIAPEAGVSWRPSPGGGAIHELELYLLIERCTGLNPGLYHYNPQEHCLYRVEAPKLALETLADMARVTAAMTSRSQVVIILAARFQRMQIKYQSMTYAAILKNVGCLYQTMYLVATAMKLAPCALGGGHSDLFSQATSLNYYAETSVGEFVLGTRAQE